MGYAERMRLRARALAESGHAVILALESSCDDTAVAVVRDGRELLGQAASSQIPLHQKYGGVVPEVASRRHVETITPLIGEALDRAGLSFEAVDAIAVTYGPGLVGALLTGVSAAKGLAFALDKPLIPVNHIEGHISANFLSGDGFAPPFLCLVVSGGHTYLVHVRDYGQYVLLGQTLDDAAGEAFDKVAKAMGLPYPGGPVIDAMAAGRAPAYRYTRPKISAGPLDFSFSGLKTAVMQRLQQQRATGALDVEQAAADFQHAAVGFLVRNTLLAQAQTGARQVALAGGVAANRGLREAMAAALRPRGIALHVPDFSLCTDNAAMIGSAAFYRLLQGELAGLDLNAVPGLELPAPAPFSPTKDT